MKDSTTYALTIAYDGTEYSGWQIQPNARTIQEEIQNVLSQILQEEITVIGSGRTDQGVHALKQVAHFRTKKTPDTKMLFRALNGMLPFDIRILNVSIADQSFHSQYSALSKEYHYYLCLEPIVLPFVRRFRTHVKMPLDLDLLKKGAQQFIGTKDFYSFSNSPDKGSCGKNSIRTIYRLDVVPTSDGIRFEFEGNGFLYKMVRNIVGMLLDVACKKRPIEDIEKVFLAKDRRRASRAAPPTGLFLAKITYS